MAAYEKRLSGDFDRFLDYIHGGVLQGSASASYEGAADYEMNGVRIAVRVYERYSYFGGNRVSMNVTIVGGNGQLILSGITAGGSQAMFFKMNTMGEESFLGKLVELAENYREGQ